LALRLSDHYLADLQDRLKIRVVGNIGQDLLGMRPEPSLERLHVVAVNVTHANVRRGLARGSAGKSFVHRVEKAGGAHAVFYQRHVLVAVVRMVEPRAWLVGVHDTDLDHLCLLDPSSIQSLAPSGASGSTIAQVQLGVMTAACRETERKLEG